MWQVGDIMRNILSQDGKKKMNTLCKWRVTKDCSGISQGLVEYIIIFEGFSMVFIDPGM